MALTVTGMYAHCCGRRNVCDKMSCILSVDSSQTNEISGDDATYFNRCKFIQESDLKKNYLDVLFHQLYLSPCKGESPSLDTESYIAICPALLIS